MARRPETLGKRRTREHVIADLSINYVERKVLQSGHTVERWLHDYGIDLLLATYDEDGVKESGGLLLQVKASDDLKRVRSGSSIPIRVERVDLRSWLIEPMPVILIAYDAIAERGYWLYIQAAFGGARRFQVAKGSEWVTLHVPVVNLLDASAIRRFRSFNANIVAQQGVAIHRD